MKSKIVFPIVITLTISLACQIPGQMPSGENKIPTQTQEATSQSTATTLPTEEIQV